MDLEVIDIGSCLKLQLCLYIDRYQNLVTSVEVNVNTVDLIVEGRLMLILIFVIVVDGVSINAGRV